MHAQTAVASSCIFYRFCCLPRGCPAVARLCGYRPARFARLHARSWKDRPGSCLGAVISILPEKLQAYEQARDLYHQLDEPLPETDSIKGIAETHLNQGKLDIAENELLHRMESIRSMEAKGDTLIAHYDLSRLAVIYRDQAARGRGVGHPLYQKRSFLPAHGRSGC